MKSELPRMHGRVMPPRPGALSLLPLPVLPLVLAPTMGPVRSLTPTFTSIATRGRHLTLRAAEKEPVPDLEVIASLEETQLGTWRLRGKISPMFAALASRIEGILRQVLENEDFEVVQVDPRLRYADTLDPDGKEPLSRTSPLFLSSSSSTPSAAPLSSSLSYPYLAK
jgi:hypothetical protein